MKKKSYFEISAFIILFLVVINSHILASTYYVDSLRGNDGNRGTSENTAWKTIAKVNNRQYSAGDAVLFRCGSKWQGELVITSSGTRDNPIVFGSYGKGGKPIIRNPDAYEGSVIKIRSSWVRIEGLSVKDAHYGGIVVDDNAKYNVVQRCEASNVGFGIAIHGQHNVVRENYFHDLHMHINTPGGDDDNGAVGVIVHNSNNEVCYNRMVNCIAFSYDYGTDGGAVELYGKVDNCYIHHNWAESCDIFMEIGGGTAIGTIVAYNISVNNKSFSCIHLAGPFQTRVENFRVENNTIVDTQYYEKTMWNVITFGGTPTPSTFLLYNNIFYINDFWGISDIDVRGWNYTHKYNLYCLLNPKTKLGFTLGEGEKVGDPYFMDVTEKNYHLLTQSPAIDGGIDLGYSLDFENKKVYQGDSPDLGAYESDSSNPQNPKALFVAKPCQGDPPLQVSFNASDSYDPNGIITSYQWNFGDGSVGSGTITDHLYQKKSRYLAKLTIKDNENRESSLSRMITVGWPPVASFSATSTQGRLPCVFRFDASGSYDRDGRIASFVWDFGDGKRGRGKRVSHIYRREGVCTVTLIIKDNNGMKNSISRQIMISAHSH